MLSGNGRHRRPKQAPALLVAFGVTGAGLALPLLGAGSAQAVSDGAWDRTAECESGGVWSANTGNGYYGGFQLTLNMWEDYGGQEFADRPDLASRAQQITVAERILADQGQDAFPTCALLSGLWAEYRAEHPEEGVPPTDASGDAEGSDGADADDDASGSENDASGGEGASGSEDGSDVADGSADEDGASGDAEGSADADDGASGSEDGAMGDAEGSDGADADEDASDGSNGSDAGAGDAEDGSDVADGSADEDGASGDAEGSADAEDGASGSEDGSDAAEGGSDAEDGSGGADADDDASGSENDASGGSDAAEDGAAEGTGHTPTGRHRGDPDPAESDLHPADVDGYAVRSGDTLCSIADDLGVPGGWSALYRENKSLIGDDPDKIFPDQELDLTVTGN